MENEKNAVPEQPQARAPQPASQTGAQAPQAEDRAAPLSVGDYIIMFIVFSLPLINLILALVWGFGSGINPNRKNFAKAWLVMLLIGILIGILAGLVAGLAANTLIPMMQELFESF
jgi:hypothetical protein